MSEIDLYIARVADEVARATGQRPHRAARVLTRSARWQTAVLVAEHGAAAAAESTTILKLIAFSALADEGPHNRSA